MEKFGESLWIRPQHLVEKSINQSQSIAKSKPNQNQINWTDDTCACLSKSNQIQKSNCYQWSRPLTDLVKAVNATPKKRKPSIWSPLPRPLSCHQWSRPLTDLVKAVNAIPKKRKPSTQLYPCRVDHHFAFTIPYNVKTFNFLTFNFLVFWVFILNFHTPWLNDYRTHT